MKRNRLVLSTAMATALSLTVILNGCSGSQKKGEPDIASGFKTAIKGIGHLVLSPVQIAAGLLEGVAALPYFASTSLHKVNEQLNRGQALVTLDDTYGAAYGRDLKDVGADGDTGRTFRRMKKATVFFQRILKQYGVRNPENYILTSIDTANSSGYVLLAVVYRNPGDIIVMDKQEPTTQRGFTPSDRLYYEPHRVDHVGRKLDKVIDFGGVPLARLRSQKMQAILLTLAANSVVRKKTAPEYWQAEKRWMRGDFMRVMREHNRRVENQMKL